MKKIVFSTAAIAATFVVFSFAPAKKNNNAINKAEVSAVLRESGSCDSKFQSNQTFSKCDTRWVESPSTPVQSQSTVLARL